MNAAITSAFIALLPGSSGARLWCAAMTITMPTMSWSKSVEKAQNIDRGALRRSPISSGWVSIISPNQRRKISGVRLIFDIPLVGGISGAVIEGLRPKTQKLADFGGDVVVGDGPHTQAFLEGTKFASRAGRRSALL